MVKERRQVVRFLFLKLDASWRRLPAGEQAEQKQEFGRAIKSFHAKLLLRTYSTVGTRGDCDLLLWQAAENLETLQRLETAVFSTRLGGYLSVPHSYLGMTRKSIYEFPEDTTHEEQLVVQPADAKYLFVYPFVKSRPWYAMPKEKRQLAMDEHVRIGRKYPSIRLNTIYSYGLDDQEHVVAFEGDDPGEFLDLVMELRESEASSYTLRDTPTLVCLQMSLWEALDTLGGATVQQFLDLAPAESNGMTPVATVSELPVGSSKRIYLGTDAIALFNVGGKFYACSDRCTHGRASLSEGVVDPNTCVLTCPWHGGRFELESGMPVGGPPVMPVKIYQVKVEGDRILVG
jgi:chlorite dismutase/nitrite reductase/ring-hydroxylating ferredoxin subunit